jgi:hypothetical protein
MSRRMRVSVDMRQQEALGERRAERRRICLYGTIAGSSKCQTKWICLSLYGIYSQQFAGTLKFNEKGGGSLDTLYVQCVEDWKRIMGTYFFKCKGVWECWEILNMGNIHFWLGVMAFSARHHHENFEFSTEDGDGSVGVATEIVVRNKAYRGQNG